MNMFSNLQKLILCLLLTVACTAFYSCRPMPQYPAVLLQADSLTQSQADSAIRLLQELAPTMTRADEPVRRYYQLLTIKAQDKAFIPHTSDSLVLDLLHYYQEEGDPRLLPEACYYAGRVTRDLGDAPQALDYFHAALDATSQSDYQRNMQGQEHATLQLQGKIYAQMGYLFRRQHLYDEAIKAFEQGYRVDSINGDTVGMIMDLRDLGNISQIFGNYRNALLFFENAEKFAIIKNDTTFLFKISVQKAFLYNTLGEYNTAKEILLRYPLFLSNINKNSLYSIAAEVYSNLGENDKARNLFIKLLNSNDLHTRSNANLWLGNEANAKGNVTEAISYIREYMLLVDSLNHLGNEESVTLSQSLYNYQLREKQISSLKIQKTTLKAQSWMYVAIAAIAIILLYFEHARRRKIKQRYENLQILIATSKRHTELREELTMATMADLKDSDIYRKICQKCEDKDPLTESDWKEIESLFYSFMPEFLSKLRGIKKLNNTEWRLSLLLKIGFSLPEIAHLIGRSYTAVHASQSRLFKKLFPGGSDYENWNDFISSL